ncbi:hypothetical protein HGRIS_013764 [Hohenbuehelia grisea]|uniref:Calcipressin n=1 Tax=Hohenbuehelia grisea TaxID=104357 RepID=A0ABR3IWK1_9AGAR
MSDYSISSPSTPAPASPTMQKTNSLVITSLPKSFFQLPVLDALREHFSSFGEINQWVPLPGFCRIIVVYELEDDAELAKQHCDPMDIDTSSDGSKITLRVYRADSNPLLTRDAFGVRQVADQDFLRPPALEKNFLISPPGSPPVGWEPIKEDPPNSMPLASDIIAALHRLQVQERRRDSIEVLLDPEEAGVGVYVVDCDGADDDDAETREEDWVYGQPTPLQQKWRPIATAMPPMNAIEA